MLNERNEKTKGVIHLMVTTLCTRDCPHCCNNQYDLNSIPQVTDDELKEAHTLCITGGEPFAFTDPNAIAKFYKTRYENIKNVYVYGNFYEFYKYLADGYKELSSIDGFTLSLKNFSDMVAFVNLMACCDSLADSLFRGKSNILYYFGDDYEPEDSEYFTIIKREWQHEFEPADDSIFRRV